MEAKKVSWNTKFRKDLAVAVIKKAKADKVEVTVKLIANVLNTFPVENFKSLDAISHEFRKGKELRLLIETGMNGSKPATKETFVSKSQAKRIAVQKTEATKAPIVKKEVKPKVKAVPVEKPVENTECCGKCDSSESSNKNYGIGVYGELPDSCYDEIMNFLTSNEKIKPFIKVVKLDDKQDLLNKLAQASNLGKCETPSDLIALETKILAKLTDLFTSLSK